MIAKEGRHFYHRRENGMEDTEDLSTFYGRQFERYNRKKFEDKDANFVTEQLRYIQENNLEMIGRMMRHISVRNLV